MKEAGSESLSPDARLGASLRPQPPCRVAQTDRPAKDVQGGWGRSAAPSEWPVDVASLLDWLTPNPDEGGRERIVVARRTAGGFASTPATLPRGTNRSPGKGCSGWLGSQRSPQRVAG